MLRRLNKNNITGQMMFGGNAPWKQNSQDSDFPSLNFYEFSYAQLERPFRSAPPAKRRVLLRRCGDLSSRPAPLPFVAIV